MRDDVEFAIHLVGTERTLGCCVVNSHFVIHGHGGNLLLLDTIQLSGLKVKELIYFKSVTLMVAGSTITKFSGSSRLPRPSRTMSVGK